MALLVEILESEYARRNSVNGSYSRRAFARDLGLPVSTLCNILAGRSGISPNRCRIVTDRLGLSPSVRDVVITEIESLHARAEYKRIKAKKKLIDRAGSATQKSALLELDRFETVVKWQHFAMLEYWALTCPPRTILDLTNAIAIPLSEGLTCLNRLLRARLLENHVATSKPFRGETLLSCFRPVDSVTETESPLPSRAIRDHHKDVMALATRAIEQQPIAKRHYVSMTLAVASESVPKISEKIMNFHRSLGEEIRSAAVKDRVYVLSSQFFEATNGNTEETL